MKAKLSQIRVNPVHDQIYTTNEIGDLVESMEKNGLLEPILVTPEKVIISGHRRYLAAKFLGWEEIEIIIRDISEEDMEYTIVSSNQHRQKKSVEVLNEIQRLYQNYTRSKDRQQDYQQQKEVQIFPENPRKLDSWYW
jgi:ParB family chromosome partitioning protein